MYVADNDAKLVSDLKRDTIKHKQTLEQLADLRATQERTLAALQKDVNAAQKSLDEAQSYTSSLNAQVQESLQRDRRAATGSGSSGAGSGSSSANYVGTGVTFSGIASWYGGRGSDGMTAAHKTLPFGTFVRVTYQGKSVVVRINDRGPYIEGRVIDISRDASDALGMTRAGVGMVSCEVVTKQ